jgi:hypothetical protein
MFHWNVWFLPTRLYGVITQIKLDLIQSGSCTLTGLGIRCAERLGSIAEEYEKWYFRTLKCTTSNALKCLLCHCEYQPFCCLAHEQFCRIVVAKEMWGWRHANICAPCYKLGYSSSCVISWCFLALYYWKSHVSEVCTALLDCEHTTVHMRTFCLVTSSDICVFELCSTWMWRHICECWQHTTRRCREIIFMYAMLAVVCNCSASCFQLRT